MAALASERAHIRLRRSRRRGALAGDFVEGQAGLGVNGVLAREGLPAPDGDVDEAGLELQRVGPASDPLRRQDRRAGATEGIEHDVAAAGAVFHGIRNQGDRFDRRMGLEVIQAAGSEGVDPGVMPDVGP